MAAPTIRLVIARAGGRSSNHRRALPGTAVTATARRTGCPAYAGHDDAILPDDVATTSLVTASAGGRSSNHRGAVPGTGMSATARRTGSPACAGDDEVIGWGLAS